MTGSSLNSSRFPFRHSIFYLNPSHPIPSHPTFSFLIASSPLLIACSSALSHISAAPYLPSTPALRPSEPCTLLSSTHDPSPSSSLPLPPFPITPSLAPQPYPRLLPPSSLTPRPNRPSSKVLPGCHEESLSRSLRKPSTASGRTRWTARPWPEFMRPKVQSILFCPLTLAYRSADMQVQSYDSDGQFTLIEGGPFMLLSCAFPYKHFL